jgi:hypothetical protein
MTRTTLKRSLATAAAIAIGALAAAAPVGAQERDPQGFVVDGPYSVHQGEPGANGIIAILIGLSQSPRDPRTFTPPIGSDKGSIAGDGVGASG